MKQVSSEEYKKMLAEDLEWANRLVNAVNTDPRKFVKYKESRPITSLKNMIESSAQLYGESTAFYVKENKGPYTPVTYKQFLSDVNALGTALISLGLKEKRIGIIGETRYTWAIGHLATCCGTGTAVPLDKELPYADLKNIVKESEASAVIFDEKRENSFLKMAAEGDTNIEILISQNAAEDRTVEYEGKSISILSEKLLVNKGKALIENGDRSFLDAQIDSKETAVILFTSGTTGMAKGIMLSHRNFCADVMVSPTVFKVHTWDIFFSVLPIHHTYEFTCDFLVPIYKGAAIAYCEGLKYIVKNMQEVKPTMLLAVPAIFEALHKQIWKNIKKQGKLEAAQKGIKITRFCKKYLHIDLSDKFFKEIKNTFGGRFRVFICGGAAINPAILDEFQAFGILALQGYGLSECAPMGALNPDSAPKSNSAGVAFPGCDACIIDKGDDGIGEICLKGENVMLGYYNRPDLTAEAVIDGWFHTGDLGYIDDEGYIIITGRKKNVIITKNGKNVFPEELEYELSLFDEINVSMCFEMETKEKDDTVICVSVYPDWEIIKQKLGDDAEDNEKVEAFLWTLIDQVNGKNPPYKMIKHMLLRHKPLEKNTSNKVVRFLKGNKEAN